MPNHPLRDQVREMLRTSAANARSAAVDVLGGAGISRWIQTGYARVGNPVDHAANVSAGFNGSTREEGQGPRDRRGPSRLGPERQAAVAAGDAPLGARAGQRRGAGAGADGRPRSRASARRPSRICAITAACPTRTIRAGFRRPRSPARPLATPEGRGCSGAGGGARARRRAEEAEAGAWRREEAAAEAAASRRAQAVPPGQPAGAGEADDAQGHP